MVVKADKLPRAVLYLRMSSDKQDMSIEDQRKKVLAWAKGKYVIVCEYVDEAKSGAKDTNKRTAFLRMVQDLTTGKFSSGPGKVAFVVSVDKSRFDRLDSLSGAEYKLALRQAGVKFDSPMNGLIDWSTGIGRIMDTVLSEANHAVPLTIAEKGLQGRIRVTKEGRPNSVTPYGMAKRVTSPTGETIVVARGQKFATPKTWQSEFCPGDDVEREAMVYAFTTFGNEDISWNELARKMTEKGYPPPGKAGAWHGDTLCWMLRNPVLAGGLRIGETPKGKFFQARGDRETAVAEAAEQDVEPVYVWDTHTGIVPKALWDSVQAKIKAKVKGRSTPRNHGPYALSGILVCGNCGSPMYGSLNENGVVIYRCHRAETGPAEPKCGYWIAYERDLLPFLLSDFLQAIREEIVKETSKREVVRPDDDQAQARKQLKDLERKLATGQERFLEASKAEAPGLMAILQKWRAEKDQLEATIQAESGKDQHGRLLQWWDRYQREFFDSNPIDVGECAPLYELPDGEAVPHPGVMASLQEDGSVLVVKTKVPAAVVREKLKRIETRVSVWFRRKSKGRGYDVAKIRVQAYINGEVCYEYAANDDYPQDTCVTVDAFFDGADLVGNPPAA